MPRASHRIAWAALCLLLTSAAAAHADVPNPRPIVAPARPATKAPLAALSASSAPLAAPSPSASSAPLAAPSASNSPLAAPSASTAPLAAPVASASSAPLAAPAPSGSSAPPHATGGKDVLCGDAVVEWAEGASSRTGLKITPISCPPGLVRLEVAGAGCDFEVSRDRGFQRTEGGAFGVSPIVDLDWTTAPEPMKKALTGILSALTADPSLPMDNKRPPKLLGSRRNQIIVGSAIVVLFAAAFVLWSRRRRGAPPAP